MDRTAPASHATLRPKPDGAVRVRRVSKLFGSTPALVRIDLSVDAGTVCALLGGNGAGKTTLLRVVATALRPTSGDVTVSGYDVRTQASAVRGCVDFLPASGGAYPDLTAFENLRFAVAMRGLAPSDRELGHALARVGLGHAGDDLVRTFSSGMARRLGLARLILTRPPLAILDEPYAGLDDEGRELADEVLEEARAAGRTAIVATHERDRMGAIADRIYRLERGLLVEPGDRSAPEALDRPLGALA